MCTTLISGAALVLAALALAPLAPASADGVGVSDPKDRGHGVDLRSVTVDHGSRNVVVTTTH